MATGLVLVVFTAVYLGMALGRWPGLALDRTGIALLGAIALVLGGAIDGPAALRAIDFPTVIVLFGLMILSAQFAACGFYAWCSASIASARIGPRRLLATTIAVGGLLSGVLANDIVVFAMTPMLCVGLLRRGLDPRPFLIALAAAANAGSAATVIGNPQNILIAQLGDLQFWPFLAACGPVALLSLGIVYLVVAVVWRGRLQLPEAPGPEHARPLPSLDRRGLVKAVLAAIALLTLFATPMPQTEGVLVVSGILLVSRRFTTKRLLSLVDWPLLLLFGCLFIVTESFAATGLATRLLDDLGTGGFDVAHPLVLAAVALVGSNTIGNVPLVVLLLSILPPLGPQALYALALFSTLAGNLLIVGSLANIITVERAREAGVGLGFGEHARGGVPIALLSMLSSLLATARF
jgi:Na+/H+ antiporter NhaD/arsenite permease-like protein